MRVRNTLIIAILPLLITGLSFANNKSNDSVKWSSDEIFLQAEDVQTPEPGVTVASGYVELYYQNQHIQADNLVYNRNTGMITATGNVTFQTDEVSIACRKMIFNVEGTGDFYDALIYNGDYTIRAEKLTRNKDSSFNIDDAVITPCTQITPCWEMKVSGGKLELGDYVFLTGIFFRIMKVPVFYMPAFYLPLDEETGRTMGFLFPEFGSSSLYGTTIKEGFFIPVTDSLDFTLYATYYSEKGVGYGIESNYALSKSTRGRVDFDYLKEDDTGNARYVFNVNHKQSLLGWKFSVAGTIRSDISYTQDYSNDINQIASRSSNVIKARLTRSIGPLKVGVNSTYKESIVSGETTSVRSTLPSFDLSMRPLKLFDSPVYVSFGSNYSFLNKETSSAEYEYSRLDLTTEVGASLNVFPWLSVTPKARYRITNYSDSLDPESSQVTGDSITRDYYNINIKMKGPVFYKIFQTPEFSYADKFKHLIEPSITYNFVSNPGIYDEIIYYDGVDKMLPANEIRLNLDNRILANIREKNGKFKPREIFRWRLSQYISMDDGLNSSYGTQYNAFSTESVTTLSPLVSTVSFEPVNNVQLSNRLEYNHDFEQIASLNLALLWRSSDFNTNVRWTKTYDLDKTRVPSDQITAQGNFRVFDNLFDISYGIAYNIQEDKFWQGRVGLRYNHQCFSLILTYDYLDIGLRQEDKIGFNIELTGISGMLSGIMNE